MLFRSDIDERKKMAENLKKIVVGEMVKSAIENAIKNSFGGEI